MNDRVGRVLREATDQSPAFELAYVRSGPSSRTPTVVVPGGPGLGSILPYRGLRRRAAQDGLDLIMVEHRGVGSSRKDRHGRLLPHSAMWVTDVIDDIAAVLDHEGVQEAYLVGSSYGTYLASAFGARYPDRVAGMVLDSALQATADLAFERTRVRELFWDGATPTAEAVRRLIGQGAQERLVLDVVRAAYELGGEQLTETLLQNRLRHRVSPVWKALEFYATRDESLIRIPGHYEFDLAGAIGFRELDYAATPDGLPLDPALTYAGLAHRFPRFHGEPFDLPAETPKFSWPLVLLAGNRDVRTPPAVAQRTAQTAQDGVLVAIDNGHSALDTHPLALLEVIGALVSGAHRELPGEAARLNQLPRRGLTARLAGLCAAALRWERALRR